MRVQSKMFIMLAACAMLAFGVSCQQVSFLGSQYDTEAEVTTSTTYVAYVYPDTFSDRSCLMDTNDEDAYGLIFEDWDIVNLCVIYRESSEQYYLAAIKSGGGLIRVITIGGSKYSYRIKYLTDDETVYVQRTEAGADSTDTFSVDAQTYFPAESLTAFFHIDEDYAEMVEDSGATSYSFYPYDTDWVEVTDSEYEVSVTISSGNDRCFTPSQGKLSDTEICVDFYDETVEITADGVFLNRSEPLDDVSRIKVRYTTFDNLIWISSFNSGSKTSDLFFYPSFDAVYVLNEGSVSSGAGQVSLSYTNTDMRQYSCLSLKTSLLKESVLYPSISAVCILCERTSLSRFYCTIDWFLEESHQFYTMHNATFNGEVFMYEEGLTLTFDLETDMVTFDFYSNDKNYDSTTPQEDRRKFTKYFDDIVAWSVEFEDLPIVILNEPYRNHDRINYGSGLLDSFRKTPGLYFGNQVIDGAGLACNEYRCYLGLLYGTTFKAVKDYEGMFTDFAVSAFVPDDDQYSYDQDSTELICLSLGNYYTSNFQVINDCGTRGYWMTYWRVVAQYPIYMGDIVATDWSPADISEEQ